MFSVSIVGSCTEVYPGKKAQYVTFSGAFGKVKLSFGLDADLSKLPRYPAVVKLDAVCSGDNGKYGQSLNVAQFKTAAA